MKTVFDSSKQKTKQLEEATKSCSICLAKWYHANIYLQTGETHSCYHPAPHAIDVKKIQSTPSALHNTEEKINERKMMLAGQKPAGCQYCWNIEEMGESFISDRHIRTGSLYNNQRSDEVIKLKENPNVIPDYIEISFGNECNFRCGYCHPKSSSRYLNEIKEHGPYSMSKNHRCDIDWFKIYKEEQNPYLDAWWKWWDQIQDKVNILRITGGEPLIQKSTYKLLDSLSEKGKSSLELNINSNLGSSEVIIQKFCNKIKNLVSEKKIRNFKLFTSIDTWGPQAEYIRNGLNIELFEKNLRFYLENTDSPVTLMITFNIFSIPNFDLLLKKILEWRKSYSWKNRQQYHRINLDISYLKEPLMYDIQILPKNSFMPLIEKHLEFMHSHLDDNSSSAFTYMEFEKLRRVVEYMKQTSYSEEKVIEGQIDFWNFFKEQDRRRESNLVASFPELESFLKSCKTLAEKQ